MRGRFITLEGLDGAGKSTHVPWIARFLEGRGVPLVVTREPGGTPLGERLRELLLGRAGPVDPETETLMMFAARREHVARVIRPALERGRWVVCDRFSDATFAYQSGGSGVAWEKVATLENWVHGGLQPDLTVIFDVPPAVARQRAGDRAGADRFEREGPEYFERVRSAYLRRAREHPERIRVVDASGRVDEVKKLLEIIIINICT